MKKPTTWGYNTYMNFCKSYGIFSEDDLGATQALSLPVVGPKGSLTYRPVEY